MATTSLQIEGRYRELIRIGEAEQGGRRSNVALGEFLRVEGLPIR